MNLLIFVKMMQNCATQAAPEALVMLGALLGFFSLFSRTRTCALNSGKLHCDCVCEGAFDLLNGTVEDLLCSELNLQMLV